MELTSLSALFAAPPSTSPSSKTLSGAPFFSLQVPPIAHFSCRTTVGTCRKCLASFIRFSQCFLYRVASGTWIVACVFINACANQDVPGRRWVAFSSFQLLSWKGYLLEPSKTSQRRAKLYRQSIYSY